MWPRGRRAEERGFRNGKDLDKAEGEKGEMYRSQTGEGKGEGGKGGGIDEGEGRR